MNTEKFQRVCDVTGEGMNEGFCLNDGEMYFKYEKDFVAFLRKEGVHPHESDEFILDKAYEMGLYYWTTWGEDNFGDPIEGETLPAPSVDSGHFDQDDINSFGDSVEVHTTDCHSCGKEVQYTEVLPYCPNCLECLG